MPVRSSLILPGCLLSLPALLLIAAALVVRRRSNLCSVVMVGLPIALFPISLVFLSSTRTIINGFRQLALAGEGGVEAVAHELAKANDIASAGLVASAAALLPLLAVGIAALSRRPEPGERSSGFRSALVLIAASIPLLVALSIFALGPRSTVIILAVIVPERVLDDPELALAREVAAAIRLEGAKVEDISAALARRLTATALGAFGLSWLSLAGFVVNWVVSSKAVLPRSVGTAGLGLVLLAAGATAAQLHTSRAIASEIEYAMTQVHASAPTSENEMREAPAPGDLRD